MRWGYIPSVSVGPLRFGMSSDEAVAALDGFTGTVGGYTGYGFHKHAVGEFRKIGDPSYRAAVTGYFWEHGGLFCVVPDARFGPQVVFDGLRMVGRAPARWEAEIFDHLPPRGLDVRYEPGGSPGSDDLGLVMRAQSVGDGMLTRPALLVKDEHGYTLWDVLPTEEMSHTLSR